MVPAGTEFRAREDRWVRWRGSKRGSTLSGGRARVRHRVGVAIGVRCGAAAVWVRWVGRLFGAAEPETESRGRGGPEKFATSAAVRGSAPTAVARGHGITVYAPDLGPG